MSNLMFDTRTRARSLAFLFVGGALVGTLTLVLPHDADIDDVPVLLLAALALSLAAVLLRHAEAITEPLIHLTLAAATVILGFAVHFTEQSALYALMYTWPALYAFYFFGQRVAIAHLVFVGLSYTVVLAVGDTPDATVRLVLVVGTPLVVGLMIARLLNRVSTSMAERDRQAEALHTSEQRTRMVVDSARDGFVSADEEGRMLDLNAAAEHLLGRKRDEVLGLRFQDLAIPAVHRDQFEQRRVQLLEQTTAERGSSIALQVEIERPDGTLVPAEAMIWAVQRAGAWTFNARLTDIGERLRRRHERERLAAAEAARAEAERATTTIARLQSVADAALTLRDSDELEREIARRVRALTDADFVGLTLLQEGGTMSIIRDDDEPDHLDRPTTMPVTASMPGQVIATGEPAIWNNPDPTDVVDSAVIDSGLTSFAGVPLTGLYGNVLGVIVVGARPPRVFGEEDVDLLRLAADRAALAIDHARAYGREHRIAETLQRSLLPETLPVLPGMLLAARYVPAAAEAEVGGDWYDAVPLERGRLLLVMGDVSGKGLAAASTLGSLRNAIRAYALEGHGPADIAQRLNRLILSDPAREHMTTLVLAVLDPVEATVRWVNAGHPPPLLLDHHGAPSFLEGRPSVPLGVLPFAEYADEQRELPRGGAIVLYTDGLVERRGEHLDVGLQAISSAAATGLLEPEALCDRLLATATAEGAPGDDIAVLALCHIPLGARLELELPSEPGSLGGLRAMLTRWLEQVGAADDEVYALVLACSEACANAIEHAGAGPESSVTCTAEFAGGRLSASIRDRGRWREASPPGDQGRGLDLMRALVDEVDVHSDEDGTTVRLHQHLREIGAGAAAHLDAAPEGPGR